MNKCYQEEETVSPHFLSQVVTFWQESVDLVLRRPSMSYFANRNIPNKHETLLQNPNSWVELHGPVHNTVWFGTRPPSKGTTRPIVYSSDGYTVIWPEPVVSAATIKPFAPPSTQALSRLDGSVICARPDVKTTSWNGVRHVRHGLTPSPGERK